jgi:hypothetical protein
MLESTKLRGGRLQQRWHQTRSQPSLQQSYCSVRAMGSGAVILARLAGKDPLLMNKQLNFAKSDLWSRRNLTVIFVFSVGKPDT